MNGKDDTDILGRIKEAFESVFPADITASYPSGALPLGTYARSKQLDRLGVIVDAFCGKKDADGQPITIYSLLLFPKKSAIMPVAPSDNPYYLINEHEYDVIAYLMMDPIDITQFAPLLKREIYDEY
jgi:hypothetical protein